TASEKSIEGAVGAGAGLPWDPQSSPEINWVDTVPVPMVGANGVEMLRYETEYLGEDNLAHLRVFLIRNFQPSDSLLFAMTDCPMIDLGPGEEMIDGLSITEF